MSKWIIYHNPNCDKSRNALNTLRGNGIQPKVIPCRHHSHEPSVLNGIKGRLDQFAHGLVSDSDLPYDGAHLNREPRGSKASNSKARGNSEASTSACQVSPRHSSKASQ